MHQKNIDKQKEKKHWKPKKDIYWKNRVQEKLEKHTKIKNSVQKKTMGLFW